MFQYNLVDLEIRQFNLRLIKTVTRMTRPIKYTGILIEARVIFFCQTTARKNNNGKLKLAAGLRTLFFRNTEMRFIERPEAK
jgi:hypothetical protein